MSGLLSLSEDRSMAAPLVEGHLLREAELTIRRRFYCLGFPVDLSTNSPEVEQAAIESWGRVQPLFESEPVRVQVTALQSATSPCPPAPLFRTLGHISMQVADAFNFVVSDMRAGLSQACISEATLTHRSYFRYFFLEAAALALLSTRYCVPIHAACVSRQGRGVLLCGDSGAGKSSLAYACARAGWSYTTDDASYMPLDEGKSTVVGNHHQFRFRPSARDLFPELRGFKITPRAAGKPSIEIPTSHFPQIRLAAIAQIDMIVFLNRISSGAASVQPSTAGHARAFVQQNSFGPASLRERKERAIAALLSDTSIMTLTYSRFDDAIACLERHLGGTR